MAEYLAFGVVTNVKRQDLVSVEVWAGSHDSVLLVGARVGDPWDRVGHGLLPPGDGEEELVLHSDPDAPHQGFAGKVVHETQAVAHVDPMRRKVEQIL